MEPKAPYTHPGWKRSQQASSIPLLSTNCSPAQTGLLYQACKPTTFRYAAALKRLKALLCPSQLPLCKRAHKLAFLASYKSLECHLHRISVEWYCTLALHLGMHKDTVEKPGCQPPDDWLAGRSLCVTACVCPVYVHCPLSA